MTRLVLTLLGAPRVERDGIPLGISTHKAVALLAYLAVTGVPHTRAALAALLWPEADQAHALGALRYTLSQLKAALGPEWLQISRAQIGLAVHPELHSDVAQLDALHAQIRAHRHAPQQTCADCVPLLEHAAALGQGALLAGFTLPDSPAFDEWLLFESARLQRLQIDALATLVAWQHAAGAPHAALPYAHRWLLLDPLAEAVNQLLIQLYIATDQPTAARQQYAAFAKLLHEELTLAPSSATTALIVPLGNTAQPDAGRPPTTTLPHPTTPLIGRASDLDTVARLLADPACRMLTLLGPGGSGKTRLALALAHAHQDQRASAVVFVALAGVTTPDACVATLAAAVGCPPDTAGDPQQHLLSFLREQQLLIVLDNIEQLLDHGMDQADRVPGLLDAVLHHAPGVQLLVTSRVRVQLYEEQVYPLGGLAYPAPDTLAGSESYGAVQLFAHRACRAQPTFALTPATAPDVIRIVQLLAGQPLAIELAAAWVATLTPGEIAATLANGMELLTTAARNVPARQRSMRASYTFSWARLRPAEQAVQQALTVFRGGFTRAAAAAVAHATPLMLQHLIDHSLLASTRTATGEIRYELHELLRQFAAEHLTRDSSIAARVRTAHAEYYLGWVVEQSRDLYGVRQQAALVAIETDLENVQAAWTWAMDQRLYRLLGASIAALCGFYHRRGRVQEGLALCVRVIRWLDIAQPDAANATTLGQALAWQGAFLVDLLHLDQARTLLERSRFLLNQPDGQHIGAFVYYWLGRVAFLESHLAEAQRWFERSLAGYQAHDDVFGQAQTLAMLGRLGWLAGDYAQSCRWYAASLTLYCQFNDRMNSIRVLSDLAMVTAFAGDTDDATRLFAEGKALTRTLDEPLEVAQAQRYLGHALLNAGRSAAAQAQFEACLTIAATYERHSLRVEDRLMLAFSHLLQAHYDHVTRIAQDAFTTAQRLGSERDAGFALMLLGMADLGRGAYAHARAQFQECLARYQLVNRADDQSYTWFGLSVAHRALGEQAQARAVALTALRAAHHSQSTRAAQLALCSAIGILLDDAEIERAIELEALLMHQPGGANSAFYHTLLTQPVNGHAAYLPPAVVATARARGQRRTLAATVTELLDWSTCATALSA